MTQTSGGWLAFYNRWLEKHYAKKMHYHKQIAEYNLHRHNEAVETYSRKMSYRNGSTKNDENGFYIAEENADLYANNYNENWALHIKYKHKLEELRYQEVPSAEVGESKEEGST